MYAGSATNLGHGAIRRVIRTPFSCFNTRSDSTCLASGVGSCASGRCSRNGNAYQDADDGDDYHVVQQGKTSGLLHNTLLSMLAFLPPGWP